MSATRLPRIEKRLVHKHDPRNVHISEIYRELPEVLPAEVLDAACSYGDEAAELLDLYYAPGQSGQFQYLGFPVRLGENEFHLIRRRAEEPGAEELLSSLYRPVAGGRELDLARMDGMTRELVLSLFQKQNRAADEVAEKLMSDRLEAHAVEKQSVFRGRLLVDPTHDYWFEHPNEHIPGMLLIEGGRQMGLAVGHSFGGIPLQGVHNVIGEIKVNFLNYADISHEIQIKTVVENVRLGREGYWTWGLLNVRFYQHGRELGSLSIDSAVIKSKVLGRIRNMVARPGYRYVPHAGIQVQIFLERGGRRLPGTIGNLNLNGFQASFNGELFPEAGEYEFFIFFDALGFIAGQARLLWSGRPGPGGRRAGFKITRFHGDEDRRLLDELLKRYFYVDRYD